MQKSYLPTQGLWRDTACRMASGHWRDLRVKLHYMCKVAARGKGLDLECLEGLRDIYVQLGHRFLGYYKEI